MVLNGSARVQLWGRLEILNVTKNWVDGEEAKRLEERPYDKKSPRIGL